MPPPPASKPINPWLIAGGAGLAVLLLACLGIAVTFSGQRGRGAVASPSPIVTARDFAIRFEVTSATGGIQQINWSTGEDHGILFDEPAPWSKEVRVTLASPRSISVSVLPTHGVLTACRLLVDGKQVARQESESVVICSTTLSGWATR
jgi:hypothetical protein